VISTGTEPRPEGAGAEPVISLGLSRCSKPQFRGVLVLGRDKCSVIHFQSTRTFTPSTTSSQNQLTLARNKYNCQIDSNKRSAPDVFLPCEVADSEAGIASSTQQPATRAGWLISYGSPSAGAGEAAEGREFEAEYRAMWIRSLSSLRGRGRP
jgi:hypothetical protein